MPSKTRREQVACRLARDPSSGRSRSRSGHLRQVRRRPHSFVDSLPAEVRPPIECTGVFGAPLFWASAAKQLFQGEARDRTPDNDLSASRLDLELLALTQAGGLGDLARKSDRQVL